MPSYDHLSREELKAIFDYLDSLPYIGEDLNRPPLRVMQDRQCHCLDGGFLAALALRRLGHPPLVIDLVPEPGTDDDHVLALYRVDGCWGAVAKSNYTALRYREPVYRSLRTRVRPWSPGQRAPPNFLVCDLLNLVTG